MDLDEQHAFRVRSAALDRSMASRLESAANLVSGLNRDRAHGIASQLWAWAAEFDRRARHHRDHHELTDDCEFCQAAWAGSDPGEGESGERPA